MEIKLFGKSIFEYSKNKNAFYFEQGLGSNRESKFLPDFYSNSAIPDISNYVIMSDPSNPNGSVAVPIKEDPKKDVVHLTPKGVYELKMLHDETFKLNTDPEYVDSQLADFKDKLALIKTAEYDMARGVKEIGSVVVRLENRKKYSEVASYFDQFAYTTTSKISGVTKAHDYLKLGQVEQFLADMPKEAMATMKEYNKYTKQICEKQAVFYIVADKKDFEKSNKRRDPILLAQSPFGHFWQILGAWDKEMMFLEEL